MGFNSTVRRWMPPGMCGNLHEKRGREEKREMVVSNGTKLQRGVVGTREMTRERKRDWPYDKERR